MAVAFGLLAGACGPSRVQLPDPPPRVMAKAELERWSAPPAPAADLPRHLPLATQRIALENGLHVTVVSRLEARSTSILLHVPSMRDPSIGPVTFMGEALRAGTIAGAGEVLVNPGLAGVRIGVATGRTGTTFSWEVLSRASASAIELLGAFVLTPAFNPPDVVSQLHQEIAEIQHYSGSSQRMFDVVHAAIPGLDRPTPQADGRRLLGMSPEVLRQIHGCTMRPDGAELIVVGPVTAESVKGWASAAFGAWRAGRRADDPACAAWLGPVAPVHPEQAQLARSQLQVAVGDFDPVVIVSVPGPAPESSDYLPFTLLTRIIAHRSAGAAHALREAGATYGIHSRSDESYAHFSVFDLAGQLEPAAAKDALRAMVVDVREISENVEAAEVASAARRWRNEVITSLASNPEVARLALWQLRRGQDVRALPQILDEIARIDRERCRDVARRYLREAHPSIGVMGWPRHLIGGLGLDVNIQYLMWTSEAPAGESF